MKMTNKEAIEILTNAIQNDSMTAEQDIALAMAQKALEKQIPQKPLDYRADYKCPICDKIFMFGNSIKPNYCKKCGQRLDWSE